MQAAKVQLLREPASSSRSHDTVDMIQTISYIDFVSERRRYLRIERKEQCPEIKVRQNASTKHQREHNQRV